MYFRPWVGPEEWNGDALSNSSGPRGVIEQAMSILTGPRDQTQTRRECLVRGCYLDLRRWPLKQSDNAIENSADGETTYRLEHAPGVDGEQLALSCDTRDQ